ncbi:winged helix-turn-helix domain-containing protein [Methanosarcina sp. KYL-1]|uniref:helix-turn-helix transcriptional regulator n=1 Tax=Methanosarcina sp. KYL-1 TaxID=2602068 RepID=UPI0021017CAA|nr:winged helix-turn-helix domain-containing protein [Methanosarcina sp. KYL-1]MCQ1536699.1 winged helix-turn-helix domain-containing protein [Methanosarcina sp. KYL-1]
METPLLDLIFLSDKRKNVLLLLMEGPKNLETLRERLKASPTAVQPQIKKLKEQHLVAQDKDLYKLTDIGKIVVEKMQPLVETLAVLEENADYWADRDMGSIPPSLMRRLSELGHCTTVEPEIDHMFELIPEFAKNMRKAKKIKAIISYFHPLFPSFYIEVARNGAQVSIILPESILKRWIEDYREITEQFINLENTELLVCRDCERTPNLTVTDIFMGIALFPKKAVFDRKYVRSFDPRALAWGEELFEYYKNLSEQVTEINNLENAVGTGVCETPK